MALIVSFNGAGDLTKTVKALNGQVGKIVILDNGSDHETIREIAELENDLNILPVYFEENLGIGAALNYGIELAKKQNYKWIVTMDQDSIAGKNMISNMLAAAEKNKKAAVICPYLATDQRAESSMDVTVYSAITSGNLIPIRLFEQIGKYNEEYFIDSVDFEFCLRVRNAGFSIIKAAGATLTHKLGLALTFTVFGLQYRYTMHAPLRRYYMYRNHIYLARRFMISNPIFVVKKTFFSIIAVIEIIAFDPARIANVKMILQGILDSSLGKTGRLSLGHKARQ